LAQLFSRNSNTFSKLSIILAILGVFGVLSLLSLFYRSAYVTRVGIPPEQPVPFSHKHHVQQLGIDCRYCHTSVETSSFAGIPPTKTCMTCHSQIWTNAKVLEPVREAYRTGKPIEWTKVHKLPHFAYFNHSAHIAKGVSCVTCHGPVDHMEAVFKQSPLTMSWCLECHRNPEKYIGAKAAVFQSDWVSLNQRDADKLIGLAKAELPADVHAETPDEIRKALVQHRKIPNAMKMTECYVCHR